jgi:hypothetical protein
MKLLQKLLGRERKVGVRVRVIIRNPKQSQYSVETTALLNTGYETEHPEIAIPIRLVERLGLWPELPPNVRLKTYHTAGGLTRIYYLERGAQVQIVIPDKTMQPVFCNLAISEQEYETLLSDKLISAFKIVITDAGQGIWKFADDEPTMMRTSQPAELW